MPIHTNAANGKATGTHIFCYDADKTSAGYKACRAVLDVLGPLTPGAPDVVRAYSALYEVKHPAAPTVYIEVDFHDVPRVAEWIIANTTVIGETIAKGLCKYLGVTFVPAKAEEKPAEEPKADTEQVLYRVQVGAFAVRANADRMLDRLKKAGFTGFIVKGKK